MNSPVAPRKRTGVLAAGADIVERWIGSCGCMRGGHNAVAFSLGKNLTGGDIMYNGGKPDELEERCRMGMLYPWESRWSETLKFSTMTMAR